MKSQIKRELILTLNDDEIEELKNFIFQCPYIWMDGEMISGYRDTVVSELLKALHQKQ